MHFSAILTAVLAGCASALPSSNHILHEKRDGLAHGWAKRGSAPSDAILPMRIALAQKNLHMIPELLDDVSNPQSPNFGKHWTGDELARKFGAADGSIRAVKNWLHKAGIKCKVSANGGWVEFDSTVEQAEELLKTKYHIYGRDGDNKEHVGCDHYSVPAHVSEHVDFITPTVSLNELKRSSRKRDNLKSAHAKRLHFIPVVEGALAEGVAQLKDLAAVPMPASSSSAPSIASCASGATPDCIKAMYNIPKGNTSTMGNPLGIYETEDYYDQADLDLFFTQFAPDIENGTAPLLNSIDGGMAPVTHAVSGESVLDLEVAYPLIAPQTVRLLQTDDPTVRNGHFDSLLDALDKSFCSFMGGDNSTYDTAYPHAVTNGYNGTKMCGEFTPPTVISISYGYLETQYSPAYLTRQCLEFAKLGLAGTTVVTSSGDSGVSASFCANPTRDVSSPQFPASCPYVTTVGATMLNPVAASLTAQNAEVAAVISDDDFKSGGGFSNIFSMPSWQKNAVSSYLAKYNAGNASMVAGTQYNASGRAYPDVSALGTNVTTVTNGKVFNADGTSASAPLFASLITLVNEERMAAGRKPVGFVNPTLYGAKKNVMKDVVGGSNGGCGLAGFTALEGWDPVTGLGTPQWEPLRALLVGLP